MPEMEERRYDIAKVKSIIEQVAARNNVVVKYIKPDQGWGGYNYATTVHDVIQIAPFKKGHKGDVVGKYEIEVDCYNPVECMFAAFFRELAYCRLANKVPSKMKDRDWNDTSKFQYNLWLVMLGVEYAHKQCGIKFSDITMTWLLECCEKDILSYLGDPKLDFSLALAKVSSRSYTIVGIPKNQAKDMVM